MEWSWNPRPLLADLDCCRLSWLGKDTGLDLSSQVSRAVLGLSAPCCPLVVTTGSMKPEQGKLRCRGNWSDPRG